MEDWKLPIFAFDWFQIFKVSEADLARCPFRDSVYPILGVLMKGLVKSDRYEGSVFYSNNKVSTTGVCHAKDILRKLHPGTGRIVESLLVIHVRRLIASVDEIF